MDHCDYVLAGTDPWSRIDLKPLQWGQDLTPELVTAAVTAVLVVSQSVLLPVEVLVLPLRQQQHSAGRGPAMNESGTCLQQDMMYRREHLARPWMTCWP